MIGSRDRKVSRHTMAAGIALVVGLVPFGAFAVTGLHAHDEYRNFDVRYSPQNPGAKATAKSSKAAAVLADLEKGKAELRASSPGIKITDHERLGVPKTIGAAPVPLAKLQPGQTPVDLVRGFVGSNAKAFGLTKTSVRDQLNTDADYSNLENGVNWVRLKQHVNGIPVFQGELNAAVSKKGELISLTNQIAPALEDDQVLASPTMLHPEDAVRIAGSDIGVKIEASELVREKTTDNELKVSFASIKGKAGILAVSKVIFPLEPGKAVIAWQVVYSGEQKAFIHVIDAHDGSILFRKNAVQHQSQTATYEVYLAESPAPGDPTATIPGTGDQTAATSRSLVRLVSDLHEIGQGDLAPLGWITDGDDSTRGNNTWAGRDQLPDDGIDADPFRPGFFSMAYGTDNGQTLPSFAGRNFVYGPADQSTWAPAPAGTNEPFVRRVSPIPLAPNEPYDSGSVTNMFFWTNRYHDLLYRLGFTEGARNFQQNNFGRGGVGADPVLAEAQDYTGPDNANFMTLPDGYPARMQMYAFTANSNQINGIARDSALDQDWMLHELTHGLSNRLVGDGFGLTMQQAGGMGEGWSDFFAQSITSDYNSESPNQDPDKSYAWGGWLSYFLSGSGFEDNYFYGTRRFPYSTDMTINPMTWADSYVDTYNTRNGLYPESPLCFADYGPAEVHALGELWAMMLWEARANISRRLNQAGYTFSDGNHHAMQLVTDALKLTPTNPSFTEARDAVVQAALLQSSPASLPPAFDGDPNTDIAAVDELAVWKGFAKRGLGVSAIAPPPDDILVAPIQPLNYYALSLGGGSVDLPVIQGTPPTDITTSLQTEGFRSLFPSSPFTFYGVTYNRIFINLNGTITFLNEDLDTEVTLDHFFKEPRIAAMMGAFDISTSGTAAFIERQNVLHIAFKDVPFSDGNAYSFRVELYLDASNAAGAIRIVYASPPLDEPIPAGPDDTIVGINRYVLSCLCSLPELTYTDFSTARNRCKIEFSDILLAYAEQFSVINPFDLRATALQFSANDMAESFAVAPVEAYDLPLSGTQARIVDTAGNGNGALDIGESANVHVPVLNNFIRAKVSNVVGVMSTVSPGITITNPVAFYSGVIQPGSFLDGTGFGVHVDPATPCGEIAQLRVDFVSDQGIQAQVIQDFKIGAATGPVELVEWPAPPPSAVIAFAADFTATTLNLTSFSGIGTSMLVRNLRTTEMMLITSINTITKQITVQRGMQGTSAQAIEAGDTLSYYSIPIIDNLNPATVAYLNGAESVGTVGTVQVRIDGLRHGRIGDLTIRLVSPDGHRSVKLIDRLSRGTGQSNLTQITAVTFDDNSPQQVQSVSGDLVGLTVKPAEPLSAFIGTDNQYRDAQGNVQPWKLIIADSAAGFDGELLNWSLGLSASINTCSTLPVFQSAFSQGITGWQSYLAGDVDNQNAYYIATGGPARLVLHTDQSELARIPSWTSPGVPYLNFPNQVYRLTAYVSRSGQQNPGDPSHIPNMRIRLGVRFAMSNSVVYFFDATHFDSSATDAMFALAPSVDVNNPTRYQVDFNPVDVPALNSDPPQEVRGIIENYSIWPSEHGNLEIVETRIERYSAPPNSEGVLLGSWNVDDMTQQGFQLVANHGNPEPDKPGPYPLPIVTTDSSAITLDTTPATNNHFSVASFDFIPPGEEPVLTENKMYKIRWHLTSTTPSDNNPHLVLRTRAFRFAYINRLEVGSAKAAGAINNLIASQALPGVGSQNPDRKPGETNGGYYDQYFTAPPFIPTEQYLKRIRFGVDLLDGAWGSTDPWINSVTGNVSLDHVEVWQFDAR